MITLTISPLISETCPDLAIGLISCNVKNSASSAELWNEIDETTSAFKSQYSIDQINKIPTIKATREAYKALGKDPNRYRPSAESLYRRIVKGMPLYRINTLVDLINLISIKTGYSIGGFDAGIIQGNILLTAGTKEDEFEGIGRGLLNIEGLPVYKDSIGGIGTPTSDNERTKINMDTTRLLMIINAYSGLQGLEDTINLAINLLKQYTCAESIETSIKQMI